MSERSQQQAVEKNLRERRKIAKKYKQVFSTPEGRYVLGHMARAARILSPLQMPRADGHYDPLVTAYNDGRRTFMLDILSFMDYEEIDPVKLKQDLTTTAE